MVGLIILLILVPIVLLVLLVAILNRSAEQGRILNALYDKIKELTGNVSDLSRELKQQKEKTTPTTEFKPAPEPVQIKPVFKETPVVEKEPEPEVIKETTEAITPAAVFIPADPNPVKPTEEKRDLEKFIGENLANKIGIAVLVLGIAFFVKYAIDKDWIKETGRIIIGLVCGGILIGIAHRFRNTYRSFSSVLVGGGLTVFYFTIAFAFHQYHLITQFTAFAIMVVITVFAVLLSLYYKRQELAILATIGGFITPFLVNTGQDNYIALFTYLCILNGGLMVLAWFKRWPAINTIALFFTTIIYGGWLLKRTGEADTISFPANAALLFASLFYILFMIMNIINSLRLKNKFTAFDFIIVLSTNFLYYTAGIVILSHTDTGNFKGLFTVLLGLVNLLLTLVFRQKKSVDRNFISLLTGLSLVFISLTIPVQFKGNQVVLFWAAESVILYWLFQRSKIFLLKIASQIMLLLMTVSLIINWVNVYFSGNGIIPVIFNTGFVTTLVASVALFIYYWLTRRDPEISDNNKSDISLQHILLPAAIATAYLAGLLEIYYQFRTHYTDTPVHVIYLQAYSFFSAVLILRLFRKSEQYPLMKFVFTAFCLAFYLSFLGVNYEVSVSLLSGTHKFLFIAHWVTALLLLWLLYDLIAFFFHKKNHSWAIYKSPFTWIVSTGIIILLSVEMYQLLLWMQYEKQESWDWWENLYYKAGLSIVWGLCSFVMMWIGMKKGFRPLRIISLSLFTITLGKLFLFDIRNIPPGGKIAAFILLGVLLLAVSFMYQRLKKIIIEDIVE